ncbi:DUF2946 domain-containing protein [Pseudomonas petrae]|uniref:DUF2946 domain-containing protein n=1 Tax=Pseudomonas petrae TaxID=2912190 RepID=A0ABS9I458_9PSED|nr:DUF2946 domain-containing protein [Pseudomonas petrae]MCF7531876.1 DUF2946 domain-containing protein [Pseudomonas petrae]MCF7537439.1 DUF2946 domain-containing protein [Pseudomonas petrae]MCF7542595.1 DUF2946 domain-containing protein [Pseudomonas petrae]MCF7556804.1 DUF2946 domain-containing protein [Pseudomonas petrae]
MNRPPAIRARSASTPRNPQGAWLSLFAMLMIFIGPLISQSMPMEHHSGMAMPAPVSMSMSMSMHGEMDMSASMGMGKDMGADEHSGHVKAEQSADVDHVIWAKCGYCTLLFSCPALTKTVAVLAPVPPRPADFYNEATQHGHAQRNVFPNARSRAPPLSSVA